MTGKWQRLPTGTHHLDMVMKGANVVAAESIEHFKEFEASRRIVGTCLNVLYQAATCHRKCHGGGHLLESLCGRAYNLGTAAYNLTVLGLYDEALNLIRGLGEMTNLIMLGALHPPKIQEWIKADRKTRLREFSPVKVRRMLDAKGYICADDKWYRELSEGYTHVTPTTKPNFHGGVPFVGGRYDESGASMCYGKMVYVLGRVLIKSARSSRLAECPFLPVCDRFCIALQYVAMCQYRKSAIYSMTSSARASSDCGTVRSSALAVALDGRSSVNQLC